MPYTLTELYQLNYDVIMCYYGTAAITTSWKILCEHFSQLKNKFKSCI